MKCPINLITMRFFDIKPSALVYTVCYGDTLESIAALLGVPERLIRAGNALTPEREKDLRPGDRLIINGLDKTLYVVKPLDTLTAIAARHGADPRQILRQNNIESIYIGQKLLI